MKRTKYLKHILMKRTRFPEKRIGRKGYFQHWMIKEAQELVG